MELSLPGAKVLESESSSIHFTNRVVPVWNGLPNDVVISNNINIFKKRLGKFWSS